MSKIIHLVQIIKCYAITLMSFLIYNRSTCSAYVYFMLRPLPVTRKLYSSLTSLHKTSMSIYWTPEWVTYRYEEKVYHELETSLYFTSLKLDHSSKYEQIIHRKLQNYNLHWGCVCIVEDLCVNEWIAQNERSNSRGVWGQLSKLLG